MHSVPLNRALIPACASAAALSFRHDELYVLLQPYQVEYPTRLREHFVRVLRRRLVTPGMVTRVMLSDDCDEWWDERAGEEVLGWVVWRRSGRKEGWDDEIWGKDNWRKGKELLIIWFYFYAILPWKCSSSTLSSIHS